MQIIYTICEFSKLHYEINVLIYMIDATNKSFIPNFHTYFHPEF